MMLMIDPSYLQSLAAVIIAVNGIAFLLFFEDKRRAKTEAWRIPEGTLLCCAVVGPFGAFAAMRYFHHKTKKWKFFLVPVFLVLQMLAVFWFLFVML